MQKNSVAVVGAAETTKMGKIPDVSVIGLHADAALNAMADAGLTPADIDGVATAGISPVAWGRVLAAAAPSTTIKRVNKVLTGRFLKRYLAKQSGLALGRLVPFGVGAAVGAIGGRALARGVVRQAAGAFGPPPLRIGEPVRIVEQADPTAAPLQVEGT